MNNVICSHLWKFRVLVIFLCLVAFFIYVVIDRNQNRLVYEHIYEVGDVACMQITDQKVQVLEAHKHRKKVEVRMSTIEVSTSKAGVETIETGYANMRVYEYELKQCKEEQ